jgi:uncharacterized protein
VYFYTEIHGKIETRLGKAITEHNMKNRPLALIHADPLRLECLHALREIALPQAIICAGFVRNLIWDTAHGFSAATRLADVDVAWFDAANMAAELDLELEFQLQKRLPTVQWQVRNQARMHVRNGVAAYTSAIDAVQRFPETATCLAVSLNRSGEIVWEVETGLLDAWALRLRHNLHSGLPRHITSQRIHDKQWQAQWPRLQIDSEVDLK